MKLLTSDCKKVWLFNAEADKPFLKAGLACFMPGCESEVTFTVKDRQVKVSLPARVVNTTTSMRMLNARLSLL